MKQYIAAFSCALIYFTAAFLTLTDYGISWDETIHFRRGQAYLHYFLTGDLDYRKMPEVNLQGTNGDPVKTLGPRRSFYQNDFHTGEYFIKNDSGHPPVNGELAAVSNYIFFQKLGVLDDISSHHLFNILAASLLVFVVVSLAAEYFGTFVALISFLSLVTYPLFWGESHFNIKDPPETAFFAATIWAFLQSLKKGSIEWIVLTFIFFALAIGTKFNILFLPVILLPYLILRYRPILSILQGLASANLKKYSLVCVAGLSIIGIVFIGTWPYLWQNFPGNLMNIFDFYRGIGTGTNYQPENFFIFGFNIFPSLWILFTSPPLTLILFILGLAAIVFNKEWKNYIGVLLVLWFLVPLLRVTVPGSAIYGGIRQIMEFLPAMALISGFGAWQITKWFKKRKFWVPVVQVILILLFIWPVINLVKLHPNENVYFNSFIGGLSGAKKMNFPSWGNSFGNAYLQGIDWINQNAENGAKVVLLQGTLANAPLIYFRQDIKYIPGSEEPVKKNYFSGLNREGEYIMELTFNDTGKDFFYRWEYVEKFLNPVFELKADNTTILKVWKNDLEHTKPEMRNKSSLVQSGFKTYFEDNFFFIDLDNESVVSKVEIEFGSGNSCEPLNKVFVATSPDRINWQNEKDAIPQNQVYGGPNLMDGKISYYFAGRPTKYIRLAADTKNSCIFNNPKVIVTSLEID